MILSTFLALILLTLDQSPLRPLTVWVTDALHKIRPRDLPPRLPAHEIQLFAAQNEFEVFQIVLRADRASLGNVDVDVSDLSGDTGTISARDNITVYLEKYIRVTTPSSDEGVAGEWPDPLVPRIDRYRSERRNAFPVALAAGRNQPIWVDVYVPRGTPAGIYRGTASVRSAGETIDTIPVTLQVWRFALPSTASLKTTFGFNGGAALKAHYGKYTNDKDLLELTGLYQKAALLHRISTHGGSMIAPRIPQGSGSIDWSAYDAEVAPFLDGTILTDRDPLPGAMVTTEDLRLPSRLTEQQKQPYYAQWSQHFRNRGWLSKLFLYLWDEPTVEVYAKVASRGQSAHHGDPAVRNLVTVAWNPELADIVDIWTPLINCLVKKPGFPEYCETSAPRETYRGKHLWWYQSCASHGCNITGGEYFRGWPSYMIDASPVANRIFQWLAWENRIEGELYFNTVEGYGGNNDPWESVLLFGGNGDGTLFYPGRPDRIGGTTHIPIESIRLKLIREGLEDYEYLHLCQQAGLTPLAARVAGSLAPELYNWDHRPESLYSYRRQMGDALSSLAETMPCLRNADCNTDTPKRSQTHADLHR